MRYQLRALTVSSPLSPLLSGHTPPLIQKRPPSEQGSLSPLVLERRLTLLRHKYFTFANMVRRRDETFVFHLLNQTGRFVVPDRKLSLDIRR